MEINDQHLDIHQSGCESSTVTINQCTKWITTIQRKKNKKLANELAMTLVPQNIEDYRQSQIKFSCNLRKRQKSRSNNLNCDQMLENQTKSHIR